MDNFNVENLVCFSFGELFKPFCSCIISIQFYHHQILKKKASADPCSFMKSVAAVSFRLLVDILPEIWMIPSHKDWNS